VLLDGPGFSRACVMAHDVMMTFHVDDSHVFNGCTELLSFGGIAEDGLKVLLGK